ncbi:transposase [Collinsella aerofaciens]|nr:transposase [Collinsella aerofaciens]MZJ43591.1 transposase [Collinsella aerofaciens]
MDVHLRSTTVCALDAETGEAVARRFRGNPWGEVAEWMSGFPGPSLAAYESGYLGFAPQRELSGLGVDCVVAAVSRVPRSAADLSSKNDRNDAARMAKAILSHDISPVWVPSPEIEGLRDLAGAHDAATARLAAAKQRLLAFLARRGYAYGGTTPAGNPRRYWTYDFLRWLDKVRPADDGGIRALAALRNEVEAAAETRDGLATLMWTVPGGAQETGGPYMRDPRHPRHFTDEFKRQIVDLYNAGKPKREIMDEYDLGKSTVERWIKSINATGSPRAADNRTPEQNRILELERENRRLRMEVDVLKQAALIYARK